MERVAIVAGLRTPFVKAGQSFSEYSPEDLGARVVGSLIERFALKASTLDELIYCCVLHDPRMLNPAREVVFRSGLPARIPAHFVSNNCISSLVALAFAADAIRAGRARCIAVVGAECVSRIGVIPSGDAQLFFRRLRQARSWKQRLKLLPALRPRFFIPEDFRLKEPSTGLLMGEHCELTAQEFGIEREHQDAVALRSHMRAARAQEEGWFDEELCPVAGVKIDGLIRKGTSIEKLSALPPCFERSEKGSITAGTSSPLTDGAGALWLMAESKARREGREIWGIIEDIEFSAIAPQAGVLMAPALAVPSLLRRCGLSFADLDVTEVHEAFAAQVLATLKAWREGWKRFPEITPLGDLPAESINQRGGSISLGHPFAATGVRLVLAALRQLRARAGKHALVSSCSGGGGGCAMLLSRGEPVGQST